MSDDVDKIKLQAQVIALLYSNAELLAENIDLLSSQDLLVRQLAKHSDMNRQLLLRIAILESRNPNFKFNCN